jgi:putative transposase
VHGILTSIKRLTSNCFQALNHRFLDWTKPAASSLISGTLTDLARKKSELVAENALLRQQLIILRRQVKRPACTRADRMLLVLLASAAFVKCDNKRVGDNGGGPWEADPRPRAWHAG